MKTRFIFKTIVVFFSLTINHFSFSQELSTKELVVPLESDGSETRTEAFQKAIESLSFELGSTRLGKDFLEANKKRFESEVLPQSQKYILSVKSKGREGGQLKVELTYSLEAFDHALRQSGLVQLSRQNLRALVFLEDKDEAVKRAPWWVKDKGALKGKAEEVYQLLLKDLHARGIEAISLSQTQKSLPSEFKKANLARDELIQVGLKYGVSLVYFGLISPSAKGVIYHGHWVQVPAKRILSEVQGEANSSKEAVQKILEPVQQAQAQGTINTKPFHLTIRGDLKPKDLTALQGQMRNQVRDLRSMKERVMSQGEFTFEAESPQSPRALVDMLKTLSFQDFQHSVSLNGEDEILLQVKRR